MIAQPNRDVQELLERDDLIEAAVHDAVRDALRQHQAASNPIATWVGGRIVWSPPQETKTATDGPTTPSG